MKLRRGQMEALGSIASYVGGSDSYTLAVAPDGALFVTHEPTSGDIDPKRRHVSAGGIITELPYPSDKRDPRKPTGERRDAA